MSSRHLGPLYLCGRNSAEDPAFRQGATGITSSSTYFASNLDGLSPHIDVFDLHSDTADFDWPTSWPVSQFDSCLALVAGLNACHDGLRQALRQALRQHGRTPPCWIGHHRSDPRRRIRSHRLRHSASWPPRSPAGPAAPASPVGTIWAVPCPNQGRSRRVLPS